MNSSKCGNSKVITPLGFNKYLRPETKSLISGTWAKTLLPKIKSALYFFEISFAKESPKKSTIVLIPFSIATFAVLAVGSIPRTGILLLLK